MNKDSINDIARRTERYWYQDGIWEIGFGLVNILLAVFYLIVSKGTWQGPMALVLTALQAGVIIGAFLLINRVVKLLKERITYPRTGYVAYRRLPTSRRIQRALLSALIAAGTAALVAVVSALQTAQDRMPLIIGLVIAAALIYLGYRFNLLRMYLMAALTILLGFAVSAARLPEMLSTAAFFGGYGLLMILTGLFVLALYLRSTRPAPVNADYEAPTMLNEAEESRDER